MHIEAVVEALEAEADDEAVAFAEELRADAVGVLEDTSPLRTGEPQKFEEVFAAPGDEVYVIGRASDGELTNAAGTFQVLHEPRGTFDLLKGAAGAVALVGIRLAAGYGTVNWLLQLGRELLGVVAFIG